MSYSVVNSGFWNDDIAKWDADPPLSWDDSQQPPASSEPNSCNRGWPMALSPQIVTAPSISIHFPAAAFLNNKPSNTLLLEHTMRSAAVVKREQLSH